LSCWYKRREFGIRAAIFFSAAAVSGSFGGLLAAAISDMDGIGGRTGWEWIFILEGLATVVLGAVSPLFLVNFPDQATFLSPIDRARARKRLREDLQSSAEYEGFKMKYFWEAMADWKTYAGAIVYMGADGALYAFSLFLPSIIKELGFSSVKAQLLSVPPYAAAAISTILVGWAADKTNQRGIWNILCGVIGSIGFIMLLVAESPGLSYTGTFLGAVGIYPCIPNTVAWMANNVEGVYKRVISLAVVIGWGNLNGVMSSNIYRQQDAPKYRLGHAVVLGYMVIG
jgi:sugar phosphate permease